MNSRGQGWPFPVDAGQFDGECKLAVAEALQDKVACVERVLLNGCVKHRQMAGGVLNFIREREGRPIPSLVMLSKMTAASRTAVEPLAAADSLTIVDCAKGPRKRRRRPGSSGAV